MKNDNQALEIYQHRFMIIESIQDHRFNKESNLYTDKADLVELFQWYCHHEAVMRPHAVEF